MPDLAARIFADPELAEIDQVIQTRIYPTTGETIELRLLRPRASQRGPL